MRILHALPVLTGGGAEQQLRYMTRVHAREGHDVHVVFMQGGHGADLYDWSHITPHTVPHGATLNPALWTGFRAVARDVRPDILHTWIHQMDIVGGTFARLLRLPWLMREASSAGSYPASWRTRLRARVASRAGMIVSNSLGGDRYWARHAPRVPRRVIRNGLPLDRIAQVTPEDAPGWARDLCGPLVLSTGRLIRQKNTGRLVKALARATRERDFTAIICGEGPLRPELEERIRDFGLEDRILMPGYLAVTQVWALMKRADVFVFPSLFEGMPNAVMEAMVCGAPLVVSDIPAHRDLLDDSTARFAATTDVEGIAQGLLETLAMPRDGNPRAMKARDIARTWTTEAMAHNYLNAYHEVIAARGER